MYILHISYIWCKYVSYWMYLMISVWGSIKAYKRHQEAASRVNAIWSMFRLNWNILNWIWIGVNMQMAQSSALCLFLENGITVHFLRLARNWSESEISTSQKNRYRFWKKKDSAMWVLYSNETTPSSRWESSLVTWMSAHETSTQSTDADERQYQESLDFVGNPLAVKCCCLKSLQFSPLLFVQWQCKHPLPQAAKNTTASWKAMSRDMAMAQIQTHIPANTCKFIGLKSTASGSVAAEISTSNPELTRFGEEAKASWLLSGKKTLKTKWY